MQLKEVPSFIIIIIKGIAPSDQWEPYKYTKITIQEYQLGTHNLSGLVIPILFMYTR